MVKLSTVATISAGQSAPKNNYFSENGIPFIRAGSLEFLINGKGLDYCEKINETNAKICKLKLYPKNAVLFAKSGMSANKGRVYKLERDSYVVSHLAVVVTDSCKLLPSYFMYWLKINSPRTLIKDESYPSISLSDIGNLDIDCPSIEEQQRIVNILDKAEEIRTKKKLANEKLDEFLKSTFIDMFGDPATNPNNYPIQALEDVTKFITDGKHGDCEDEIGSGYYFVSAKCINNGRIDLTQARQIKYSDYQDVNKRVKINLNDLLIVNTGATIGKMAIVRNPNVANCITLQKSVAVINIDNTKLLTEYLCYCLKCKSIANVSAGSAIRNLLLSTMRSYKLPIPPIAMQDKFSKIVQKVEAQKEKNQKVIEQMDNLFNSLMQQAFNSSL